MKTLMICLLVISSVVIRGDAATKYLDPGVLNHCLRPNPPPGCHIPDPKGKTPPRTPAHDYHRGCSKSQRCRSG